MAQIMDSDIDILEQWILEREHFTVKMITDFMGKKRIGGSSYFQKARECKNQVIEPLIAVKKIKRVKNGQYDRCDGND